MVRVNATVTITKRTNSARLLAVTVGMLGCCCVALFCVALSNNNENQVVDDLALLGVAAPHPAAAAAAVHPAPVVVAAPHVAKAHLAHNTPTTTKSSTASHIAAAVAEITGEASHETPYSRMPKEFRIRYKVEQQIRARLDARAAEIERKGAGADAALVSEEEAAKGEDPLHMSRAESEAVARRLVEKNTETVAKLLRNKRRVSVKAVLAKKGAVSESQKKAALAKATLKKEEKMLDGGLSKLLTHAIMKKHEQDETNWLVTSNRIKEEKKKELKRLQRTRAMWKATEAREKARRLALKKLVLAKAKLVNNGKNVHKINKGSSVKALAFAPGQTKPTPSQAALAKQLRAHIIADAKRVDAAVKSVKRTSKMLLSGQELAQMDKFNPHAQEQEHAKEMNSHWSYLWGQQ